MAPPSSNAPVDPDWNLIASRMGMDGDALFPKKAPQLQPQGDDSSDDLTLLVEGAQPSQDLLGHNQKYFSPDFTSGVQNTFGGKTATFDWSGDDSDAGMKTAGKSLATTINLYRRNHPDAAVNVVAHSHGGNVAFMASQSAPIDTMVTLGTPIVKNYQPNSKNVGLHINGYSPSDLIQSNWSYDWKSPDLPKQTLPSAINVKIPQPDDILPSWNQHFELLTPNSWDKIDSVYKNQP